MDSAAWALVLGVDDAVHQVVTVDRGCVAVVSVVVIRAKEADERTA